MGLGFIMQRPNLGFCLFQPLAVAISLFLAIDINARDEAIFIPRLLQFIHIFMHCPKAIDFYLSGIS